MTLEERIKSARRHQLEAAACGDGGREKLWARFATMLAETQADRQLKADFNSIRRRERVPVLEDMLSELFRRK